jgi:hypothetical protein
MVFTQRSFACIATNGIRQGYVSMLKVAHAHNFYPRLFNTIIGGFVVCCGMTIFVE